MAYLMNIKKILLLLLALTLLLLLAACNNAAATPTPERPPLRVEYTRWWSDYTMLIAQELNLFEKHGVKVEPVFYEVFSEALAAGATVLLKSGGSTTLTPNVIVFRGDVVQQRPDDIRAYLKAWFEAVEYRRAHPKEANQIIAKALKITPEELSEDAQLFTAPDNTKLFSGQAQENSLNLAEVFKLNVDFLIRLGMLGAQPKLDELLDGAYLP